MGAFPPSCRTGRQADTREQKQTKSVPYLIIIIIDFFESAYPAAQSAEQAYTHNVHRDGKCYIYIYKKNKISTRVFKHCARDAHTHKGNGIEEASTGSTESGFENQLSGSEMFDCEKLKNENSAHCNQEEEA